MKNTIKQLNALFLQSHEILEKTTDGSIIMGVPEYVPHLDAVCGYLQNERQEKIALSVRHNSPTVYAVVGHKDGNEIKHECNFSSLESVNSSDMTKLYSLHLLSA